MAVRAKFKGAKNAAGDLEGYLNGIPARDLDEDEDWKDMTPENRERVRKSELYDTKTDSQMSGSSSSSESKKGGE
jgi:hypothetical protein